MQKEEEVDQWPSAVQLLLAVPAQEQAPVRTGHTCVCRVLASRPSEPVPSVPSQGDSWVLPAGVSEVVWSMRGTWAGICLSGTFCLLPQLHGLGPEAVSRRSSPGALASAGWQPLQVTAMAGLTHHTVGLLPGSAHCWLAGWSVGALGGLLPRGHCTKSWSYTVLGPAHKSQ